jgi:hypothetical protein
MNYGIFKKLDFKKVNICYLFKYIYITLHILLSRIKIYKPAQFLLIKI